MGQIIEFGARRAQPEPSPEPGPDGNDTATLHGNAFCMGCNHEWEAVAPAGTHELECPQCHAMRGKWKFDFAPPEPQIWECNCGNQLFNITPNGTFCPGCGNYLRF